MREQDPQLRGILVAHVREDGEGQRVLLRRGEGLGGQFRRDGDEGDAFGGYLGEVLLQGTERQVAVGAPFAAVEGDEEGPVGEEVGAADLLVVGVGKGEGGQRGADFDCGGVVE